MPPTRSGSAKPSAAYREEHSAERARAAGFDEYVEKPLDPFRLYLTIERLTRRQGHRPGADA
jgi:CheY-like chemotaxis protein